MKIKKFLGQHFLRNKKILLKIADFAQIEKGDTVLEVGPGEGGLTEFLLEKSKKVIAVEKDAKLVEFLKQKFKKEIISNKLQIIEGDILEFPLMGIFKGNYILVGNIPYYITGAIFKKFLESDTPPQSITFVVQKEVADRIIARDGKESVLSISIKAFSTPEFGGVIKAGSFYP
ncbi:MAG: rRNA adenine dimethyltransferase family protein, partial [Patescibacteria group bacterium]